jgi:cell division protein FtsI (penicillin-binding protein 3)
MGLALGAFVWAVLVLLRLVQVQVVSHKTYLEMAQHQQNRPMPVDAPRGAIFDREGRALALSVPADSVSIDPLMVPDRPMAAEILARALGVDREDLLARMNRAVEEQRRAREQKRKPKGTGFLWVKRKISPADAEALRSLKLDWMEFQKEPHRYYPDGPLASHVVGTVDFEERGNLGLEQKLDRDLAGHPGKVSMLTDPLGRAIDSTVLAEAEAGRNLTLTIDESIQFVAERELRAACEYYHAASGSTVVMDPNTGEILALASYPVFDPNRPASNPRRGSTTRFRWPSSRARSSRSSRSRRRSRPPACGRRRRSTAATVPSRCSGA